MLNFGKFEHIKRKTKGYINPNRHGLSNSTYDMGGWIPPPPNISESRHHSTTKISQNNLLHVNLPFCIKNALYFMPTAWIGLIGLKYEILLIFDRGVIQPPNFYRTFIYHWAYDILHEKSIYCLNRPNWLEIPISCYLIHFKSIYFV